MTESPKAKIRPPEIVKYVMAPFLKDLENYFDVHLRIHKAHVVMLADQQLISSDEARGILGALVELEQAGPDSLNLHFDTDLYMQMEAFVTSRAPAAGAKMHMGRSRNDLYSCGARMMNRQKLAALLADTLALQKTLLDRAAEHVATVMPGYTHLQHAEPITFGHYLLAFFDALSRDVDRLRAAFDRTNWNALGAAALASTSFALDRERTSVLLGFNGVVENSYDAVASRDYLVETVSAMAILASTITRVVDALIIWSTSEFAMIDLPDGYGYTSSIMPQKRNPGYFLESVRSKSARISGDVTSTLATLKGTTFAQSRDTSYEITVPVFHAFDEAQGVVNVMRGIMAALVVRRETMEANCAGEYSGATEVANLLVRDKGLPFRTAYQIVANTVKRAAMDGLKPAEVAPALVDAVATEVIGRPVGLTDQQLRSVLDPAANVELKQTTGGPSRKEVERMLAARRHALEVATAEQRERQAKMERADATLKDAIETRLSS